MRKVFSSQRLENVEAMANLLRAEGIEVRITNGRGWRGHRRGNFSYDARKETSEMPAVWIVRAEDQPRGRQLLRDLGLFESSREPDLSFLPEGRAAATGISPIGKRIKLGVLGLICLVLVFIVLGPARKPDAPATAAKPVAQPVAQPVAKPAPAAPKILVPETIDTLQVYRVDVPTALAATLVQRVLREAKPTAACIAIDGGDPTPAMLQAVDAGAARLQPASDCVDAGSLRIAVEAYMTDGSGSGEVSVRTGETERTLKVERDGTLWRVKGQR